MRLFMRLFPALLLAALTTDAIALDVTSYRILSMGNNLRGIVDDPYTDVMMNPARLVNMPTSLEGKASQNISLLQLGYFKNDKWALAGEWTGTSSDAQTLTVTPTITNGLISQLYTSENTSKSDNNTLSGAFMKSFSLDHLTRLGVGIVPTQNTTYTENTTQSQRLYYSTSGAVVETADSQNASRTDQESASYAFTVGGYRQDVDGGETDLVFTVTPHMLRQTTCSNNSSFTDYDPDQNGRDINNRIVNDPDTASYNSGSNSLLDGDTKVNYALDFRRHTRPDSEVTNSWGAGVSYQPDEQDTRNTSYTSNTTVNGTTVTNSTTSAGSYQAIKTDNYTAYYTIGQYRRLFSDKLLLAYMAGAYLTAGTQTKKSITDPSIETSHSTVQSLTGTLAATLGAEYTPVPIVALRAGISPSLNKTHSQEDVTDYSGAQTTLTDDTVTRTILYSAGIGFRPADWLAIDLYTTGNIVQLNSNYNVQVQYLF